MFTGKQFSVLNMVPTLRFGAPESSTAVGERQCIVKSGTEAPVVFPMAARGTTGTRALLVYGHPTTRNTKA